MKILTSLVGLGVGLLSITSFGAMPTTQPARTPALTGSRSPTVVKDLDVPAGASVVDVLRQTQQEFPDFQYVAVPGAWQNCTLPRINLRDVTPDGIVNLLATLVPTLRIDTPPNTFFLGRSVYVFQSAATPAGAASQATQLSAYGLADPIARLGYRDAAADLAKDQEAPSAEQLAAGRKKALKEVLSLLEAAATQADPSFEPSLKLHEETEVLLVRGTAPQLAAVTQSLQALNSAESSRAYQTNLMRLTIQYNDAKAWKAMLKDQLDGLKQANDSLGERVRELTKENAALKDQIRAAQNPALERRLQQSGATPTTNSSGDKH
jgi:hypothetical protein